MSGTMTWRARTTVVAAVCMMGLSAASAVDVETVAVGNPGNLPDIHDEGYGAVDYVYRIGKYEVTAGQYAEFLNAVAATDTYGLYNPDMGSSSYGCKIRRHGAPGGYTYTVAAGWANRPVNYVSWGDAARFANWMHNGQPGVDQPVAQNRLSTEDGAYRLNGATGHQDLLNIARQPDWQWAICTEDEWYKAAYHKNDGATGNYFDWPTGSDDVPSNRLVDGDPGNNATFCKTIYIRDGRHRGDYTVGSPYYRSEVGAHENSDSPYGTFDQGGNVWEWNESVQLGLHRGIRGGSYSHLDLYINGHIFGLYADSRGKYIPHYENDSIGFRVCQVPEPASLTFLTLAAALLRKRAPRAARPRLRP